jgi:hypothetical protein
VAALTSEPQKPVDLDPALQVRLKLLNYVRRQGTAFFFPFSDKCWEVLLNQLITGGVLRLSPLVLKTVWFLGKHGLFWARKSAAILSQWSSLIKPQLHRPAVDNLDPFLLELFGFSFSFQGFSPFVDYLIQFVDFSTF